MTALLFDVDGVLVDSAAAYERIWRHWAGLHGLDGDTVVAATFGRRGVDTVAEVAPHLAYDDEVPVLAELLERELHNIPAMPGAVELVTQLPAQSWGCVTSGTRDWVRSRLSSAGITPPAVLVTAEDVDRGKPDPACYLLGAERLGRPPADCTVVEDAPAGIAAAHAAGMTVVGLTTTHPRVDVSEADYVFESLVEAGPFLLDRLRTGQ
jgi:sugar-phosphatase